jgi:hypothetical protein
LRRPSKIVGRRVVAAPSSIVMTLRDLVATTRCTIAAGREMRIHRLPEVSLRSGDLIQQSNPAAFAASVSFADTL